MGEGEDHVLAGGGGGGAADHSRDALAPDLEEYSKEV